ncbi:hypothetical protein ES703_64986 [subsurface metagenome]
MDEEGRATSAEQESYTCPKCGMTSYHPEDVKHEYCGNCHKTKRELEAEAYFRGPGELPNDERKCSGRAPSFSNGLLNCQYVYTDCQYVNPDLSLKKGGIAVRRRFERE